MEKGIASRLRRREVTSVSNNAALFSAANMDDSDNVEDALKDLGVILSPPRLESRRGGNLLLLFGSC
jgi:hypothetical protein